MDSYKDIPGEMRAISPLVADIGRSNPYILPQDYFRELPGIILEKIQDVPALLPEAANAYKIPGNYFDSLPAIVLSRIKEDKGRAHEVNAELEPIAPLLNTISKVPVYTTPEGYFEQLKPAVGENTDEQVTAKLASFKNYRRWIQYAAAAMVGGILVTGAFFFTDSSSYLEQEKKGRIELQAMPDTTKDAGILQSNEDVHEEAVENVFKDEKSVPVKIESEGKTATPKTGVELISDEELKKYLEENAIPEPVYPDSTETEDSI